MFIWRSSRDLRTQDLVQVREVGGHETDPRIVRDLLRRVGIPVECQDVTGGRRGK